MVLMAADLVARRLYEGHGVQTHVRYQTQAVVAPEQLLNLTTLLVGEWRPRETLHSEALTATNLGSVCMS